MKTAIISIIVTWAISLYVTSSFAATTIYYVIIDPITQYCTIVDAKPKESTRVVVTMSSRYIGRAEAERGLMSIMGCMNYRARGA